MLEIEPTEFQQEALMWRQYFGARPQRVDFIFYENQTDIHIVEVKNPKNTNNELNRCIAQILDYICLSEANGLNIKSAWLITTKFHPTIIRVIQRFNLPINVCVISKSKLALYNYKNFQH